MYAELMHMDGSFTAEVVVATQSNTHTQALISYLNKVKCVQACLNVHLLPFV